MAKRLFIMMMVVFLAGLSPAAGPPSSPVISAGGQSGLIRSVNPIDTSRNLVITGNVRDGRHFRGIVPYGSTTDFGGTSPSSSFDSFLPLMVFSSISTLLFNLRIGLIPLPMVNAVRISITLPQTVVIQMF